MTHRNSTNNRSKVEQQMLSAGEIFRRRRMELRKTIPQVSDETKVQPKYIEMLENNEFDKFETEVFMNGYIKIYCKYLGLNLDKVLALTRRTIKSEKKQEKILLKKEKEKVSISPKLVIALLLSLFVLAVIVYFSYQIYNFQQIPNLVVTEPEDNYISSEETIYVKGFTDDNVILLINGIDVDVNDDGAFEREVVLVEGTNTISVQSIRKNNSTKENVRVLSVTYRKEEDEVEEVVEEEVIMNTIRLNVSGGEAWIQLLVDGSQKIGNVVNDGFSDTYEVKEDFQITTGRTDITSIYLNNNEERQNWSISNSIGTINCRLVNNAYSCDN